MKLFLCCFLCSLLVLLSGSSSNRFRSDAYPKTVPKYAVRLDHHTKKPVVSGLVHTLPERSTLSDFKKHLQCAPKDPNLNFNNGVISKYRMAPYTMEVVKSFCSYAEKRCEYRYQCNANVPKYEAGGWSTDEVWNAISGWSWAELIRVVNGTLYYDWPWGAKRFHGRECTNNPFSGMLNLTLSRITDMRDSAFFTGGADPAVEEWLAIPYLAECTHDAYNDQIFPWYNMWINAVIDYKKFREEKLEFNEEGYEKHEKGYLPWHQKVPKAALFASFMPHRIFLFEAARERPDLIDASGFYSSCIRPFHPLDTFDCDHPIPAQFEGKWPTAEQMVQYNKLPPGYSAGYFNITLNRFVRYSPGSYKYVVVPLGAQEVLSTSARIMPVMFYSGAVVLAPRTEWKFHFQAQLLPWVHYVPISYSGADLAEKVEWLRDHDDLARQIAENGRNFARSWLRLEDIYCYTAHTLDAMAELSKGSDVLTSINDPTPLPQICGLDFELKAWLEWPV